MIWVHTATAWMHATAAGHGIRDWFALLANVATVAGIFAALWGGWVALRSYQFSQRSAANSHMHGLFCDYLKTDYATAGPLTYAKKRKLTAIMLYTLEEMYIWILREESLLDRFSTLMSPSSKRNRRDGLNGWRSTIVYHVKANRAATIQSLLDYASCYSVRFLEFVANQLDDEDLGTAAAAHRNALQAGIRRPPGLKEGAAWAATETLPKSPVEPS